MILIENVDVIAVMDDAGTEMEGGSILIDGGAIRAVSPGRPAGAEGAEVIDGRGLCAIPGLINTHHHLYQVLTRVRAQEQGLFGWLTELYPVWARLDAEWVHRAAGIGLSELARSGCSTTTDHHYVFPAGRPGLIEAEIQAADEIGIRFHPCRGSMDLGQSAGGLPPDSIVQDMDTILADTEALVRRFHDPSPGSMRQIAIGPCSPFSVSDRLMRESVALARRLGVRLHTHIAETQDEEAFCRERFGTRPLTLLEEQGFLGEDVWLAHCVHLDRADIDRIRRTGTAVASCPSSNGRLGSGIAPVPELVAAGVPVGFAVDGSASNDAGNLLAEARQGMLMARARSGPGALTARQALWIATRGGAACLGRSDIGSLRPGQRADIALYRVDGDAADGVIDQVAALVFLFPRPVHHLFVEGRPVVRAGELVSASRVSP
ncbi:MAG TPA: 8-oxoguanine deaminase [Candidatus Limnocylindrales bacterium]|nr:8-oxoguanine deaminase [Candidatus Limnocylindrales bacterium]